MSNGLGLLLHYFQVKVLTKIKTFPNFQQLVMVKLQHEHVPTGPFIQFLYSEDKYDCSQDGECLCETKSPGFILTYFQKWKCKYECNF